MHEIKESLEVLKGKISTIEDTLGHVLDTQKRQDLEMKSLQDEVRRLKDDQVQMLNEVEERDRRRPNLIVSGFPEKDQGPVEERKKWDRSKVEDLVKRLCNFNGEVISSINRIGKANSSKPRLLRVVCRDVDTKYSLIRNAKNLRQLPDFNRIFLNPDLTPIQQNESKYLREELKTRRNRGEDVKIHRGKIVQNGSQNFC